MTHFVLALMTAVMLNGACSTGNSRNASGVVPQRVQSPEGYIFETGAFSEANSLRGDRIVLILDYYPTEPGKVAIAEACLDPLPADFEIGYAVCDNEERTRMPVFARHVDQRCSIVGKEQVYRGYDTLITDNCTSMNVRSYMFDPPLQLMIDSDR